MRKIIYIGVIFAALLSLTATANACVPTPEEQVIWDGIKQSSEPREFLSYLKEFPKGCFRTLANFKIKSLVDLLVPLQLSFTFTAEDGWRSSKEGEWLTNDGRPVEWMRLKAAPTDTSKFELQYQCDAAGVGLTEWFGGDQPCAARRAPIQGFSVRMRGFMKDFYDLQVQCSTHHRPDNGGNIDYNVADGDWCGVRAGTPSTYLYRANITVRRKAFDS
ncbi:hypothetical protein [Mesorhizobium sp. M0633]|uniref:hypothetical protein n=1 Tax=unclassified Mesorhizobium TaxID=325217 RepID=UPI0033375F5F